MMTSTHPSMDPHIHTTYSDDRVHPWIILLESSTDILEQEGIFIKPNTHYTGRYEKKWSNPLWQKLATKDICITLASDAHDPKRAVDISNAIDLLDQTT